MSNKDMFMVEEVGDKELDPETVLATASQAKKDYWISIIIQLFNSHRFTKFVESNYLIGNAVNKEDQTIETIVVEKPIAVGPPLSSSQVVEIRQLLKLNECKRAEGTLKAILKLLGQDEDPSGIITDLSDAP